MKHSHSKPILHFTGNSTHEKPALQLTGATGPLPDHYAELICQLLHEKQPAFVEFLHLFEHAFQKLLLLCWQHSHLALFCKRADSTLCQLLQTLAGNLLLPLTTNEKHSPHRDVFCYAARFYCYPARPISNLVSLLEHYCRWPVKINHCQGTWLDFNPDALSRLGQQFHALGHNTLLGTQRFCCYHAICIDIGPISYAQYCACLPPSPLLSHLDTLITGYLTDPSYYILQITIAELEHDLPAARLDAPEQQLGWNTWLGRTGCSTLRLR